MSKNKQYPQHVQQDLDEEEKRLKEEHEQRMKDFELHLGGPLKSRNSKYTKDIIDKMNSLAGQYPELYKNRYYNDRDPEDSTLEGNPGSLAEDAVDSINRQLERLRLQKIKAGTELPNNIKDILQNNVDHRMSYDYADKDIPKSIPIHNYFEDYGKRDEDLIKEKRFQKLNQKLKK